MTVPPQIRASVKRWRRQLPEDDAQIRRVVAEYESLAANADGYDRSVAGAVSAAGCLGAAVILLVLSALLISLAQWPIWVRASIARGELLTPAELATYDAGGVLDVGICLVANVMLFILISALAEALQSRRQADQMGPDSD